MAYIDTALRATLRASGDSVYTGGGSLEKSGNYAIFDGNKLLGFVSSLTSGLAAQYPGCYALYVADGSQPAQQSDGTSWYDMRGRVVADENNPKVEGNFVSVMLTAALDPADTAANRWISSSGAYAFRAVCPAFSSTTELFIGWSSTYDDFTAVDTAMDAYDTAEATPDGSENTDLLVAYDNTQPQWIYLPDAPAKTIVVRANGAALVVSLELIKVV